MKWEKKKKLLEWKQKQNLINCPVSWSGKSRKLSLLTWERILATFLKESFLCCFVLFLFFFITQNGRMHFTHVLSTRKTSVIIIIMYISSFLGFLSLLLTRNQIRNAVVLSRSLFLKISFETLVVICQCVPSLFLLGCMEPEVLSDLSFYLLERFTHDFMAESFLTSEAAKIKTDYERIWEKEKKFERERTMKRLKWIKWNTTTDIYGLVQ